MKRVELMLSPREAATGYLAAATKALGIKEQDIAHCRIVRRSIDARRRGNILVNMALEIYIDEPVPSDEFSLEWGDVSTAPEVVVVGAGPAGLFAALELIELGFCPVVLERGKSVSERKRDIAAINRNEPIDSDSNYSFGEGGAGTYSDGKLYTRSKKRGVNAKALAILRRHGASEEILYDAHPHIGTDKLPRIIQAIRETIVKCGGRVEFNCRVTDYIIHQGRITGVVTASGTKVEGVAVILATGHSARDVYQGLFDREVYLQSKNFAVGVRVEHQQSLIDRIQYKQERDEYLPAASYSLVAQVAGRGVYSFCMCPGGFIVPAATANGECVVNGMSPSGRNNIYANSGIVTQVLEKDIPEYIEHFGVLGGMRFQEQLERMGAAQGGGAQIAPAQRLDQFVAAKRATQTLETSYHPGVTSSDMHHWMPDFISKALRGGFKEFDKKMRGYLTADAQVIGVESRTSSPVRIPRGKESYMHEQIEGLFPSGEGAGYAGGIISAAIDGMQCAQAVARYKPNK
ncbi:MAG: FAD-dependent monooxygenase [Rikenellaceae bacterium]